MDASVDREQWPFWVHLKNKWTKWVHLVGSKSDLCKIRGDPCFLSTDVSVMKCPSTSPGTRHPLTCPREST